MNLQIILDLTNVRRKPLLLESLPFIGNHTANAFFSRVYLPRTIFDDIHSANPNPYYVSLLIHEQEHLKRQSVCGELKWVLCYISKRKFRFEEELAATIVEFKYLQGVKLVPDIERKARILSGHLYLWPTTYETALIRLKEGLNQNIKAESRPKTA